MSHSIIDTLNVLRHSPHYNAWLYSHLKPHLSGSVLDIGSGLGNIACHFNNPAITEVILTDHAPNMISELNKTPLPLRKYRTLVMDITDPQLQNKHSSGQADVMTCINVLEHIQDDIEALRNMKYLLKKGGKIVILAPALPFIYGTLDQYVEHHRRYTKTKLHTLMTQAGFTVKSAYYMNFLGICTWFIAGKVLRQQRFHKKICRLLDHTVPLLRIAEQITRPPIGQSLIMIGEC